MGQPDHNHSGLALQLLSYLKLQSPVLEGHSNLLMAPEGHCIQTSGFGSAPVFCVLTPGLPGMGLRATVPIKKGLGFTP